MPKMRMARSHNTTQGAALDILEQQIPLLVSQFGSSISSPWWERTGDVIAFSGKSPVGNVKGTVQATAIEIILSVDIPLAAVLVRGPAEQRIQAWVDEVFGP